MLKRYAPIMLLVVISLLVAACAAPTPQIVEKEVIRTVVVEKEVPVEKKVVETVIVEKEVQVIVTPTPQSGAQQGGKLSYGQTGDIKNLDPFDMLSLNYPLFYNLYDSLIRYDNELNIMPRLATSWIVDHGFWTRCGWSTTWSKMTQLSVCPATTT